MGVRGDWFLEGAGLGGRQHPRGSLTRPRSLLRLSSRDASLVLCGPPSNTGCLPSTASLESFSSPAAPLTCLSLGCELLVTVSCCSVRSSWKIQRCQCLPSYASPGTLFLRVSLKLPPEVSLVPGTSSPGRAGPHGRSLPPGGFYKGYLVCSHFCFLKSSSDASHISVTNGGGVCVAGF